MSALVPSASSRGIPLRFFTMTFRAAARLHTWLNSQEIGKVVEPTDMWWEPHRSEMWLERGMSSNTNSRTILSVTSKLAKLRLFLASR